MAQLDPRLISSLQELVLAAKAIDKGLQTSWWKAWGPTLVSGLITIAGWLVLVWLNENNARHSL